MGTFIRIGSEALIGGEVNTTAPHTLGLSEAASSENLDPRDWRGAKTRNGRSQYGIDNGSNTGIHGLKAWTRDAGTAFVVARIATTFYDVQAGAWASIGIGGTSGSKFRAAALNDILAIVVDGLTPMKWNGATFATLGGFSSITGSYIVGTPSEAKYITVYASKLILAGDDANPQTIFGSATNNPEDFTATNDAFSITTQDGGGDTIQGVVGARNWCNVFYRYYTEMLLGTSVFDLRVERLIDRGLVSTTGYVSNGDVVFFASDEAVYLVARGQASDLTTLKQREWYSGISDKTKITLGIKGDLLIITDYGADTARAYDYKNGRWAPWPTQPWECMDTSNEQVLYAGTDSGSTAQIWKLDTGSLDGTATITAFWRTPDFAFGWPDCPKNMAEFRVLAKPGLPTTTVQFYKDGTSIGSAKTLTFSSSGNEDWKRISSMRDVRGQFLGAKITWTGQGTLFGFAFYGEVTADSDEIPVEA